MANPFYCTDRKKYTQDGKYSIMDVKTTSNTILLLLNQLFHHNGHATKIKKEILAAIKEKRAFTVNANNCDEKMQFLVNALENADNREIFMSSPLKSYLVSPFVEGYTSIDKQDEKWANYKRSSTHEVELARYDIFTAATFIDRHDRNTVLGLDVPKILDLLVKKDANGKYYLTDKIDAETKALLLNATEEQLKKIRSIPRFKENYERKPLESESEDE